ncbi:MAG: hypothetical protein HQM10_11145 [Candidatus Riflebacteria bacterium]|nr:hypothetical protein [Candidatus Riflebacteria bacterium]
MSPETKIQVPKGAKVAGELREDDLIVCASGWGDFSETRILDSFVSHNSGKPLIKMTTHLGHTIRCTPDHMCFCRLNSLPHHYYLYLMERSTMGFRLGMTQNLMKDLCGLQNSKPSSVQSDIIDRIWLIEGSESLPQSVFMLKYSTAKYGLPDIVFSGMQSTAELPDDYIKELFNRIDTPTRARQLLQDHFMFESSPHVTVKVSRTSPPVSNAVQLIIFGASEKSQNSPGYSNIIRIDSAAELKNKEQKGFKRRMNSKGLWHLEITRDDLDEALLFVKTLSCLDNLEIVKKIQLTKKAPFYILPASHLKLGMIVPVLGNRGIDEDTIKEVAYEDYDGQVFDIKPGKIQNYIAGNWVLMSYSGHETPSLKRDVI